MPNMSGFADKIGSGQVCQTAKVCGYGWGSRGCAGPRPHFIFGGALKDARCVEAVKSTV
jgi:hypothetical protein